MEKEQLKSLLQEEDIRREILNIIFSCPNIKVEI